VLADPQSITVNAVAQSMGRILSDGQHSTYQKADLTWKLDVRHRNVIRDKKRRVVSLVTFTQRKIVADPLTSANDYEFLVESFQIDRPEVGFTSTEVDQQWAGLKAWADTTMIGKIYGQES
jgi:ParB-like chromosome segregation protein Spo0J